MHKSCISNVTFSPTALKSCVSPCLACVCCVAALLLQLVAAGFACPCHLCLCVLSSWRWHDSSSLRVPLQGAKSFRNPFQGRCSCILVTQCCSLKAVVKSEALKGPQRIYLPVHLSSEGCNYHWKEMKGFLEYWMNTLSVVCIAYIISNYCWLFDKLF